MVIRSQEAVTVVTSSPVCLYLDDIRNLDRVGVALKAYAITPESASRSMKIVPRRICPDEFRYVSRSHGSRARGSTTE